MKSERFDLNGKAAIVTGAGRGIGKTIALGLAQHGANVVLCSRTGSDLEKVVDQITALGQRALPVVVDMTQVGQFDHLVEECKRSFQTIDILVNNAGILLADPAEEVDEKSWDVVMDTNAKGPFFLCQKVGRAMIEQGNGGSIINITSEVVQRVEVDFGAYCPSKAALNSITKVLAREWGKYGIRVNSLAPCFVNTEMNAPHFAKKAAFYEPKLKATPLGRHSETEDLVGGAVFLASDASSFITGTTILVDGGITT